MQFHWVLQGNMQITLQTKPEKPAMGRRVWNLEATATDGTVTRIPEAPLLPPPLSPPRPRSCPAAPHRPGPVPPAQPQSPGLPGWAGRTAT